MNPSFEDILAKSFEEFSDSIDDNVSILPKDKEKSLFADLYVQVWEIETGLYDDENSTWLVEELTMYVAFSSEFPLVPAKIFFSPDDFSKIGHIPHITYDTINNVCVFDEFVIMDKSKTTQAIIEQLNMAKQTLIDGIKGKNHADFEDEFIAYWETKSDNKDRTNDGYFSIIEKEPENPDDIQALLFRLNQDEKSPLYALLFNKQEDAIESYKDYLESAELEFEIQNVFYLGEIEGLEKPPFSLTIEQSQQFIPNDQLKKYKAFINDLESPYKIHVFLKKIQGKTYYLGWRFPILKMKNLKGFRKGALSYYQFLSIGMLGNAQKNVLRFVSNDLNLKRLIKRTSSDNIKTPEAKNFLIAGVGSVGSNLIPLLNNLNFPDFTFVDNDTLDVENIGRHLLGFKYLNKPKVDALKMFLKGKLPTQNIEVHKEKVTDLYSSSPDIFNNQDYIFFCTGKQSIEKWFIEEVEKGNLTKPIFILWVEPYLLGGQCIYIHPSNKTPVTELFYDIYKYKHAVIDQEELVNKRDLFTLKESGCQSTFSPYSASHLSLFISAIYPKIFEIIENNFQQSMAFTWVGDTKIAEDLDIKLNIEEHHKYSIIENEI